MFGDAERARDWIARALLLDPDNLSMRYNLACSLAHELGDPKAAIDTLQLFFEKVNSPMHIRHLEVDPDLDGIRNDPRFKDMLAGAKQRLGIAAN
jgi:adenylate cyclase